ncbi:mitochondrial carrier [Serendipita vermifera]|nr:mitochondrial carrier [Serendipita vermifera]
MSSDPKPASLRDLYTQPVQSWNFPQQTNHTGPPSASPPMPTSSTSFSSTNNANLNSRVDTLKWGASNSSGRPYAGAGNSSFIGAAPSTYTGSSYAAGSFPYGYASYDGPAYGSHAPRVALKALLASAFLQYTTTAIAMPWEVGKVLLQVQWVPKRIEDAPIPDFDLELELELEEEDDNDELSESSTDDSYFHDPTSPTRQTRQARARPLLNTRKMSVGLSNNGGRINGSPLIIQYGPANGVWGMMKRVGASRTEGWGSLWKGLLTSVTLSLLTSTIQPSVSSFLRPIFPSHSQSHFFPSILLPLTSHIITGVILSPLDTLRTLQIIHPRPSPSPWTLFSLITSNKSSEVPITLGSLYTHPTLLLPALLDNTLRPLISLLMPRIIENMTGVRIGVNVWMYPLCEFIGGVIGLGITIPIETIRRRLQAQVAVHGLPDVENLSRSRSSTKASYDSDEKVSSCVHLSPRPYTGILDCLWRILTEERSPPPKRQKSNRRPSMRSPRASSATTTPKARKGKATKPRLSGGPGSKRDVRSVFDAEVSAVAGMSHRPRMLSEEMRMSERRASQQHAAHSPIQPQAEGGGSLGEKVEKEIEKVRAEIESEGIDGWLDNTGLGQLYRGFGMGVGALALVLVLGLITGEEPEGWAEL